MTIDERIEQLDTRLFNHVKTTTPVEDQCTLLALQAVFRRIFHGYVYLEIGSYQGGSLQPYVVDPKCAKIISIDPRPGATPDARGIQAYSESSLATMMEGLQRIPGADIAKVQTFEASTRDLRAGAVGARPQLCFVDGEHTDEAVLNDARFCLSALAENGAIAFHDANLVFKGLQSFLAELLASGRPFRACILPNFVFLIEIGTIHFSGMEPLRQRLQENYKAYLAGMEANDWYRVAYHMPIYRALRRVKRFFIKPKMVPASSNGVGRDLAKI